MTEEKALYHEKQSQELCALHALNNLFQEKRFAKKDFDAICLSLSPDAYINPHRSFLGLGNYDINVIMSALDSVNYETIWFDKRKDVSMIALEHVYGFILNIPSFIKLGFVQLPIQRKHWISIRKVNGIYYNFDSKSNKPEEIGSEEELLRFLNEEIKHEEKQLMIVVEKSLSSDRVWKVKDDSAGDGCKDSGFSSRSGSDTVTETNVPNA